MAETQYTTSYQSSSGVDMHVTFGDRIVGELQGLSFTISREIAPLYTMGSANPRGFSKGKRGIAGSLVFLVFDRSGLAESMKQQGKFYMANRYETYQGQLIKELSGGRQKAVGAGTVGTSGLIPIDTALPNATLTAGSNIISNDKVMAEPWYLDQIPPFNIVITNGNEHGHTSCMAIYGVQIMNHGSSMSIDDINVDESVTFVATDIKHWNSQYKFDLRTAIGTAPRHDPGFPGARGGGL